MKTFKREDVVGKTVIETTGTVKGKVTDVTFDLGGGITLIVKGMDGTEYQVPVARVTGISDHVVGTNRPLPRLGPPASSAEPPRRRARYGAPAAGSHRFRRAFYA